jgi:hypothetical protein
MVLADNVKALLIQNKIQTLTQCVDSKTRPHFIVKLDAPEEIVLGVATALPM